MLIVRIAHPAVTDKDGLPVGPYCAGSAIMNMAIEADTTEEADALYALYDEFDSVSNALHDYNRESFRPVPQDDGIGHRPGMRYGFSSFDAMERWFSGDFTMMDEAGFMLYMYEVPDNAVKVGESQIAAWLNNANLISIDPIPFTDSE